MTTRSRSAAAFIGATCLTAVAFASVAGPPVRRPGFDVNGDGFADVLLGGKIVLGGAAGLSLDHAFALPASPGTGFLFDAAAQAGDVDGDGFDDLLVGDPGCPDIALSMPLCEVGHAYLFSGGPTGPRTPAKSALTAPGGAKNTHFGGRMAAAGDVDRDGHADVLLAERGGVVWLYRGSPRGLDAPPIKLPRPPLAPGEDPRAPPAAFAVTDFGGLGDVDGDGHPDVAVAGGWGVAILRGAPGGLAPGDPLVLPVPAPGAGGFGIGAIAGGDFDGDHLADVAIGAPYDRAGKDGEYGTGRIYVHRGGAAPAGPAATPTWTLAGPGRRGGQFGQVLASVGDLDRDGFDDLVAVASCAVFDAKASSCTANRAYVYRGGKSGLGPKPLATLGPARKAMWTPGGALLAAGDVDGDGFADFLYGAYPFRGGKKGLASSTPKSL